MLLGLRDLHHSVFQYNSRARQHQQEEKGETKVEHPNLQLPTGFDWRTQNSACTHSVRSQRGCGACWAFSTAGFLEDRFCIATNGGVNIRLSPQDMVDCDMGNGGCNGGYLTPSLEYAISEGLVPETCMPYKNAAGYCLYQCDSASTYFQKYRCKAGSMMIATSETAIKEELYNNGPMMVGFTVYYDFMSYSSGIYEHVTGSIAGGHAVKLIGWDYDGSGRLYWICQNQWNTSWGESGYFRIYANEAGLDSAAWACTPDV